MPEGIQKPSPQPTYQTNPLSQLQNTKKNSESTESVLQTSQPLPKLIYLATPYSHPKAQIRSKRFSLALDASAKLMARNGDMVYSPIVQCHLIAIRHSLPTDSVFWQARDQLMITLCDTFACLISEGWRESIGIKAELEYARALGRPVWMVAPKDLGLKEENYL